MAADALFGQDFSFSFTPIRGDAETAPNVLVSARLYLNKPTDAEVADSANALATALQNIVSWSAGTSTNEKLISFAQILDPDPADADAFETYYVVVSHKYGSSNQIQSVESPLIVWRSALIKSRYGLAAAQVYEFESRIQTLQGDTWTNTKISRAEKVLKDYLRDHDVEYKRINAEDFQNLLGYQTMVLIAVDLMNQDRDVWESKLEYYTAKFEDVFRGMKFRYDYDGDGVASPNEVKEVGVAILGR